MRLDAIAAGNKPLKMWSLFVIVLCAVQYLFLAFDERHHWHEWRYLYSATHYSISDLGQGVFDPGPPPERTPEEVGAWYWGQMLHVSVLRGVVQAMGPGQTTVLAVQLLYGLWLPFAVLFAILALRRLGIGIDTGQFAVLVLLSPLGVYIGFKLMPEGPALLFSSAGIWAFAASLSGSGVRRLLLLAATALCAALSFLAMDYMPLLVFGFIVAWSCCWSKATAMARWLGPTAVVFGSIVLALALAATIYDVSLADYLAMYGFFREYIKPPVISLFGIASAWSALYVFVICSGFSRHRRTVRFFVVWLMFSLLPLFVFSSNYIESRFLSAGIFPLAALTILGMDWFARYMESWFRGLDSRWITWGLILSVVPLVSWASLPFMPYEMNAGELRRLAERVHEIDVHAAVLIPWNYTDFHYLRVAFPERSVYLVQSPLNKANEIVTDPEWMRRRQRTYGDVFIADSASMQRLEGRALYYIGHGMLPPLRNLKRVASTLGLDLIARRIDDMNPLNHIARSWLWHDPEYIFQPVARDGNYSLYRVEKRVPVSQGVK